MLRVDREPFTLEVRAVVSTALITLNGPLVPVDAQPVEIGHEPETGRVGAPLAIGIFDPQYESATAAPGKRPTIQRRASTSDMQIARRTGSEASDDGHLGIPERGEIVGDVLRADRPAQRDRIPV